MKVEENRAHRIRAPQDVVAKVTYIDSREVFLRFDLQRGRYIVVPTTFDPGQQRSFMLRLVRTLTENPARSTSYMRPAGSIACVPCCLLVSHSTLLTVFPHYFSP